jgi:hypothetical protein
LVAAPQVVDGFQDVNLSFLSFGQHLKKKHLVKRIIKITF